MALAGELLRAWREKKAMTQGQAAELLGVTQACLSDWERGKKSPGVLQALEVARKTRGAVPVESWGEKRTGTDG